MTMNTSKLPSVGLPGASPRKHELRAQDRDADPEDDQGPADYDIPSTLEALSDDELYELSQHEVVIQRGLKTFYEVGEALMVIREKRLYRQTYHTFEEYCQQRWDMSRFYAHRLISASEVASNLLPIGNMPTNESQVRPLTKLATPEEQQAAWQQAVASAPGGKVTGAHVAAVVDEMKPRTSPPSPLSASSEGEPEAHAGEPPVVEAPSGQIRRVDEVDDYVPDVEAVQVEAAGGVVLTVGATVWTPSGHEGKVLNINGRYAMVGTVNGARQYEVGRLMVTGDEDEEVPSSEFQVPSEEVPAAPAQPAVPNYKLDAKRTFPADETVSQPFDFCQTPPYALEPLLPYLGWSMPSTIWEPACGEGLLVQALFDGGWTREHVVTSDIRTEQNFFEYEPAQWDIIVTNPPYSLKYRWLERCYELGKPFALLLPVESLGAKAAQDLMQQYGFEMMLLDTRINFKMPNKGWDGSSPFPTFWLTWHLLPEKVMFGQISEGKKAFSERL